VAVKKGDQHASYLLQRFVQDIKRNAHFGNENAMFLLAAMYYYGLNGKQSQKLAHAYFHYSNKRGNPLACAYLRDTGELFQAGVQNSSNKNKHLIKNLNNGEEVWVNILADAPIIYVYNEVDSLIRNGALNEKWGKGGYLIPYENITIDDRFEPYECIPENQVLGWMPSAVQHLTITNLSTGEALMLPLAGSQSCSELRDAICQHTNWSNRGAFIDLEKNEEVSETEIIEHFTGRTFGYRTSQGKL